MANDNYKLIFGANTDAVGKALENMNDAAKKSAKAMDGALSTMNAGFEKMKGVIATVTAVVAGGAMFANMVKATRDVVAESKELARVLGTTVTQASAMRAGFDSMQLTQEQVVSASQKMQGKLVENEAAFNKMGIATRDSNGNFRATFDILTDTTSKLSQFKEGTDRNVEGSRLFGKSWGEMSDIIRLNKDSLADAEEQARQTGQLLSGEMVSATEQFIAAQNDLDDAMEGTKVQVGVALMPALTTLTKTFNNVIPVAIDFCKKAFDILLFTFKVVQVRIGQAISVITNSFGMLGDAAVTVGKILKLVFVDNALAWIETLRIAFQKLLAGDFSGSKDALANGFRDSLDNAVGVFDEYKAKFLARGAAIRSDILSGEDEITNFVSALGDAPAFTTAKSGTSGIGSAAAAPPKNQPVPSEMGKYEEELAKKRLEIEKAGNTLTLEEERKFWQDKLSAVSTGSADSLAVQKKITQLELQELRAVNEQKKKLSEQDIGFQQEKANRILELNQSIADFELQNGQITQEQHMQQLVAFEESRYQIQLTALKARLALAGQDVVTQRDINNQIELAQMEHNQRSIQISMQGAKQQSKIWDSIKDQMSTLWDAGLNAMMNGTLTFNNALRAIGAQMLGWFAKDYVGKKVKTWLLGETLQTGATKTGALERFAIESWAAIKSVALKAWSAIANVAASAWEAMAGAYAAIVGIPYVGPVLAPVAAGVAFAGVMAIASNIASASGGYDIPAGVNPMTQLHQREMVLPAHIADPLRDNLANGKGLGGGGDVHLHINAIDGASVKRVLMDNPEGLKAALQKHKRNGVFG